MSEAGAPRTRASVVIPAHDEGAVIVRLLDDLLHDAEPDEFEIVVVCNGCTDNTAELARAAAPGVRVIEIAQPSKAVALARGDLEAQSFPRVYVDADVQLGTADLRVLAAAVERDGIEAAGPRRIVSRTHASRAVGWYYDVWERLPQVRDGLFGRGVIAVSETGVRRIGALPPVLSDDLAVSELFAAHERVVTDGAQVVVHPPRTLRGLINRRVRVHAGTAQLDQVQPRRAESRTSLAELARIARAHPRVAARIPVFLGVAVAARLRARRQVRSGDFVTWQRDDSRTGPG